MIDVRADPSTARLAGVVRAWGLGGFIAALLRDGGPLPYLGAQALYFAAPLLDAFGEGRFTNLAHMLEDPEAVQALADQLGEEA